MLNYPFSYCPIYQGCIIQFLMGPHEKLGLV